MTFDLAVWTALVIHKLLPDEDMDYSGPFRFTVTHFQINIHYLHDLESRTIKPGNFWSNNSNFALRVLPQLSQIIFWQLFTIEFYYFLIFSTLNIYTSGKMLTNHFAKVSILVRE